MPGLSVPPSPTIFRNLDFPQPRFARKTVHPSLCHWWLNDRSWQRGSPTWKTTPFPDQGEGELRSCSTPQFSFLRLAPYDPEPFARRWSPDLAAGADRGFPSLRRIPFLRFSETAAVRPREVRLVATGRKPARVMLQWSQAFQRKGTPSQHLRSTA